MKLYKPEEIKHVNVMSVELLEEDEGTATATLLIYTSDGELTELEFPFYMGITKEQIAEDMNYAIGWENRDKEETDDVPFTAPF